MNITDWMGRYRPLVAALSRHTNIVQRSISTKSEVAEGISLNSQEWQVLEAVISHSDGEANMNQLAEPLGIPQSSFSKIVKTLCGYELLEKYQTTKNRKNIILLPTELGISIYKARAAAAVSHTFDSFFEKLSGFSDEEIRTITEAIECLNTQLTEAQNHEDTLKLVKKET